MNRSLKSGISGAPLQSVNAAQRLEEETAA
jgi:hypothetical protein